MPDERKTTRFVITWNFPNCWNYWKKNEACNPGKNCCNKKKSETWKNYYSKIFKDSTDSAAYSLISWKRLYDETMSFKETMFSSTLPPAVLEAVTANISILKTPTTLRLEDGSFYGWEGCACNNPWNEIECGSNYARSMSSYSLLLSLSGFEYDMAKGYVGFSPKINEKNFKCFLFLLLNPGTCPRFSPSIFKIEPFFKTYGIFEKLSSPSILAASSDAKRNHAGTSFFTLGLGYVVSQKGKKSLDIRKAKNSSIKSILEKVP